MNATAKVTAALVTVEIVPFKSDHYDRGSKKIIVNGEEWGKITMESHGCHGPSYHAHDMHGSVLVGERKIGPHKGEGYAHKFWPKTAKKVRWDNIGKPVDQRVKPVPTEVQLRVEVESLIAAGHLRSPATRDAEIERECAEYRKRQASAEEKARAEFRARALAAVPCALTTMLHDALPTDQAIRLHTELESAIVEAMRWAQTQ